MITPLLESLEFTLLHTSVVTRRSLGPRLPKVSLTVLYFVNLTLGHTFPAFIEKGENIRMQIFEN